jgi:choline dehydrogenase-like flavoprotein
VNVNAKYNTKEMWRDVDGKELNPHTNYYVGGNTKFYGAALFRLRQKDFGEIRHHGGISPAWPISYDELEPYYTQAEHLYQVHGNRGEDPTEPAAGKAYPWPAVSHEARIQHLADDFRAAGLNPFHTPLGVMLDEKNPRLSPCIRCNTCDGFPWLVRGNAAKSTTLPTVRHTQRRSTPHASLQSDLK